MGTAPLTRFDGGVANQDPTDVSFEIFADNSQLFFLQDTKHFYGVHRAPNAATAGLPAALFGGLKPSIIPVTALASPAGQSCYSIFDNPPFTVTAGQYNSNAGFSALPVQGNGGNLDSFEVEPLSDRCVGLGQDVDGTITAYVQASGNTWGAGYQPFAGRDAGALIGMGTDGQQSVWLLTTNTVVAYQTDAGWSAPYAVTFPFTGVQLVGDPRGGRALALWAEDGGFALQALSTTGLSGPKQLLGVSTIYGAQLSINANGLFVFEWDASGGSFRAVGIAVGVLP